MRTRLLASTAAVLASVSCIHRVAPSPPSERTAYTGVPLPFTENAALPEGSEVAWDFGDGTPEVKGANVSHAFGKVGVYTIVETIRDKDGEKRTGRTHVATVARQLTMAVPGDVRAALLVPKPWARMQVHREIAGKLSLGPVFDEMAGALSDAVGFNVLDPKVIADNGFDPDEGVAAFTVPQDPEALVLVIGANDDAKALDAARKVLATRRGLGRYSPGPFQLSETKLPDGNVAYVGQNAAGDKVAVMQRYGYLYLRTAGASDPIASLKGVAALPPDKGIFADPGFVNASRHIGTGDAIFYSRAPDSGGRFSNELGTSAFAVVENSNVLQVRIFSQLRNLTGDPLAAAFKPLRDPPDLASRLPSGASVYLRISAAPDSLWRELQRMSGTDVQRLRDRVQDTMGLDLQKDLIPSFAGNIGAAMYLDASSLIEAIMGEEVGSFDKSAFVIAAQLTKADTVQAALERALKGREGAMVASFNGANVFRFGDAAQAAVKDDVLFLVLGGAPARVEEPPAKKGRKAAPPKKKELTAADLGVLARVLQTDKAASLSQEFKKIGVQGFEIPGQQNLWVNIAGIVKSIERAGAEQGGVASAGSRLFADRAADLRDALFEAHPGKDGIDATLWVRFAGKAAK